MMMARAALVVLLCVCAALAQPPAPKQATLYPLTAEGFDTIWLDDISFATELHWQTFPFFNNAQTNFSFYVFGGGRARSVSLGDSFSSGPSPNDNWMMPYIDVHSFPNGTDTWFLGIIQPLGFRHSASQYEFEIVALSSSSGNRRYLTQPDGFEGLFFASASVPLFETVVTYWAGFFQNGTGLQFGVYRTHLNLANVDFDNHGVSNNSFTFNATVDSAVILDNTMLVDFNANFKPFIFHMWNTSWGVNPNYTYTYVIEPYSRHVSQVIGDIDGSYPLYLGQSVMAYHHDASDWGQIVSAEVYYPGNLLIIGISAPGTFTGSILTYHLENLTISSSYALPTNFSDPRALVIDQHAGHLYVAMNGGPSVLKFNISNMALIGQQALPFWLHRVWTGVDTPGHVYFATNEQHAKVFRVSKHDFCPSTCMQWGFCKNGECECPDHMVKTGHKCEFQSTYHDRNTIKKEKGGEVALGILFMFAVIAAAAGWFMWFRTRRHTYQAV